MQNTTDTLNATLTFSHLKSPFTPNLTTHGKYRWNHTTSAAVVYRPASLLTPWPILAAGLGMSLIQALWTFISNVNRWNASSDDGGKGSLMNRILDWSLIAISTLRSWSAFIRAIQAVSNNSARSLSPTASFTLAICMFPATIRPTGIQGLLMWLNILFAYTSFELMLFARYRGKADFYGSFYLAGGTCPWLGCSGATPAFVGCFPDRLSEAGDEKKELNKDFGPNMVGSAELVLGMVYNITLLALEIVIGLALLAFLLYLPFLIYSGAKRLKRLIQKKHQWQNRPSTDTIWMLKPAKFPLQGNLGAWKDKIVDLFHEDEDNDPHDTRDMRRVSAVVAMLIVGLSAIVILPITYSQQSGGKTVQVTDAFGPRVQYDTESSYLNFSLELNGSWSDCFDVPIVNDRLGFVEFWWDQNKARVLDWLAVM